MIKKGEQKLKISLQFDLTIRGLKPYDGSNVFFFEISF